MKSAITRVALRAFAILPPVLLACSCTTHAERKYQHALAEVKSVAVPGRQLGAVKTDLEKKGYEVSRPFDSNVAKDGFNMAVYYGATIGFITSVKYAMELPTGGPPVVIVVEADRRQRVTGVHE